MFKWFRKKKEVQPAIQKTQRLIALIDAFKGLSPKRVASHDKRRAILVELRVYSDDIWMLLNWVIDASEVIAQLEYAPDSWKKNTNLIETMSLDDFLTPGGHDIDLEGTMVNVRNASITLLEYLSNIEEDDAMESYYMRVYSPLLDDLEAVHAALKSVVK